MTPGPYHFKTPCAEESDLEQPWPMYKSHTTTMPFLHSPSQYCALVATRRTVTEPTATVELLGLGDGDDVDRDRLEL